MISGFGWDELHVYDTPHPAGGALRRRTGKGAGAFRLRHQRYHGHERSDASDASYVMPTPSGELVNDCSHQRRALLRWAPAGTLQRAYGTYRMVKYAQFLLREVIPQHDELCFEEGRLMLQYAAGDTSATDRLKQLQGQTARLYDKYWSPVADE